MMLRSLFPLFFLVVSLCLVTVSAEESGPLDQLKNIKESITSSLSPDEQQTPPAKGKQNEKKSVAVRDNSQDEKKAAEEKKSTIELLLHRKNELDKSLEKNNIWSQIYSNYHTYLYLLDEKKELGTKISYLEKRKYLTQKEKKSLAEYREKEKTIEGKLMLLKEYEKDPFNEIIKPKPIDEIPTVSNPVAIITAISYKKKLLAEQMEYNNRFISLKQIVDKFQEEKKVLEELVKLDPGAAQYKDVLTDINERLKIFVPVLEIFKTTQNVYTKKIDEIKLNLKREISREMQKGISIGAVLLFFFAFFLLGKFLVHRYMSDNNRFYMINKALNFTFVTILFVILLFSYIENVSYLVTVLGFASAGIAIAMKDWFMSMMGWFVIVIGGTIHVGDRVKFVKDGVEYVGDIVDISMMRMTLHEDVTLTTYMQNRRAGRMIFIPNNYIFTDMIANYSHAGLKTVWDGIDFMITFDSDIARHPLSPKR